MHEIEIKRAKNLIWLGANDYTFEPKDAIYRNEKASIYGNLILGAMRKYKDMDLVEEFLQNYESLPQYPLFTLLLWIVFEEETFEKLKCKRKTLDIIRKDYAKYFVEKYSHSSPKNMKDEFELAMANRMLDIPLKLGPYGEILFNEIFSLKGLETKEQIIKFNQILKDRFHIQSGHIDKKVNKLLNKKNKKSFRDEDDEENLQEQFGIGAAEFNKNILQDEEEKKKDKSRIIYRSSNKSKENLSLYIEENFGRSILSDRKVKMLEDLVCTGNHKGQKLHFTDGLLPDSMLDSYRQRQVNRQKEHNIKYYENNISRINRNINKLSNTIKNAILTELEYSKQKSRYGILNPNLIWRNQYLQDQKVFYKEYKDDFGDISVDILLDASASQQNRQEEVSTQGYIISESFKRAKIKSRIWSFTSLRGYTILKILKDFDSSDNMNVFNYFASASNRDGLAIKTILSLQESIDVDNKILIVLSDGKPNDERIKINTLTLEKTRQYSGDFAVKDTAIEVRKGRQEGKSILGVFYGEEEDAESARVIYGNNFAKINGPESFSDIVGRFLKEEIKRN